MKSEEPFKRHEDALVAYGIAVKLDPNFLTAYKNQVLILFQLKRFKDALKVLDSAVSIAPEVPSFVLLREYILKELELNEEAPAALKPSF